MNRILILFALLLFTQLANSQTTLLQELQGNVTITVDAAGGGDYLTVQAGIDAVPSNSANRTVVLVKNGRYYEKVRIPSTKKNLVLIGEDMDSTIITYDDYAGNSGFECTTVRVDPDDFLALNLTIENTFQRSEHPDVTGTQALALYTNGDRQMFAHCKFESDQDTYFSGSEKRAYFKDCLIIGDVDFIYGPTTILFDSCQIHNVRTGAYFTAASTPQNHKFGYVFKNCWLTFDEGVKDVWLGRPWRPYAHVCWYECYMAEGVNVRGWHNWSNVDNEATARYEEYNCYGPGADISKRVNWGKQLNETQAATYTTANIFAKASNPAVTADWLPTLEQNEIYEILKKHTFKFLSQELANGRLTGLQIDGKDAEGFHPDSLFMVVELPSGSTNVPTVTPQISSDRISYQLTLPESVPGFATIDISTPYKAMDQTFEVYFSVDQSYHSADLKGIVMNGDTLGNFDPADTLYKFAVPEGNTSYFKVVGIPLATGAKVIPYRPRSIPSRYSITVTAIDGVTKKVYYIDVYYGVLSNDVQLNDAINFQFANPTGNVLKGNLDVARQGEYALFIFDASGKKLKSVNLGRLVKNHQIELDISDLSSGIYLYKIMGAGHQKSGRIVKSNL